MERLYKREKYLSKIRGYYHTEDLIKVITGVRRCGKSSLMAMVADELRAEGVPEEQIIYLDLDARRHRAVRTADELEKVILEHTVQERGNYLFIDEVQNVTGFEEVINGFRNDGGYSIFITGSNSYLLSGELATKLTGRYVELETFPLTYDEYEGMKRFFDRPISPNPAAELSAYILEGGFPRTVLFDSLQDKRRYVESVVSEILKDIRRRVQIRDRQAFETVQNDIIHHLGEAVSVASLCERLRGNGLMISRATVDRYLQALVDAKILYVCDRFDMKAKRSLRGEKKYYLSDLGFYFARNTDNQIHFGPVLENLVYIYARSLDYAVSVGRIGKLEVDFILRDIEQNYAYVQVACTILASDETQEREYRPLERIRDNYAKYVMTTDTLLQKRNGIHHVNIEEFMLQQRRF